MGSPTKSFITVRQKNRLKIVLHPLSYLKKLFDNGNSLKQEGLPYEDFRYCETKKIRQK